MGNLKCWKKSSARNNNKRLATWKHCKGSQWDIIITHIIMVGRLYERVVTSHGRKVNEATGWQIIRKKHIICTRYSLCMFFTWSTEMKFKSVFHRCEFCLYIIFRPLIFHKVKICLHMKILISVTVLLCICFKCRSFFSYIHIQQNPIFYSYWNNIGTMF